MADNAKNTRNPYDFPEDRALGLSPYGASDPKRGETSPGTVPANASPGPIPDAPALLGEHRGPRLDHPGRRHDPVPEPLLKFFRYGHLPAHLADASAPFAELAAWIVRELPRNAERTVCLRLLLQAKDAGVRTLVVDERDMPETPPVGENESPIARGLRDAVAHAKAQADKLP